MFSHPGVLLLTTAVFVAFVSSSDGLSCWVCSSKFNPDCDDTFTGDDGPGILKRDCKEVPSPSKTGPIPRTIPATTCMTNTLRNKNGDTIVSRGCASPGDRGIPDAISEACTVVVASDGSGSSTTCFCKGDFCNGAETLKLTTVLGIIPLGLLVKALANYV